MRIRQRQHNRVLGPLSHGLDNLLREAVLLAGDTDQNRGLDELHALLDIDLHAAQGEVVLEHHELAGLVEGLLWVVLRLGQ